MDRRPQLILTQNSPHVLEIHTEAKDGGILTVQLLDEIRTIQDEIVTNFNNGKYASIHTILWMISNINKTTPRFNLRYILYCLQTKKTMALSDYIDKCLDVIYLNYHNLFLPIINISYFQLNIKDFCNESFNSFSINIIHMDKSPEKFNNLFTLCPIDSSKNITEDKQSLDALTKGIKDGIANKRKNIITNRRLQHGELIHLFNSFCNEEIINLVNTNNPAFDRQDLDRYKAFLLKYFTRIFKRDKKNHYKYL